MDTTRIFELVGAVVGGSVITGGVAFFLLRYAVARLITKIENAVTKDDIRDFVRQAELQAALLVLEKELQKNITDTRHALRNEMQAPFLHITEQIEASTAKMGTIAEDIAEMRGIMQGARISVEKQ